MKQVRSRGKSRGGGCGGEGQEEELMVQYRAEKAEGTVVGSGGCRGYERYVGDNNGAEGMTQKVGIVDVLPILLVLLVSPYG